MTKNKRKFLIRFWGDVEVDDYTEDGARYQVEMMKNISTKKRITTNSTLEVIGHGLWLNCVGIFQMIIALGLVYAWTGLLDQVSLIKDTNIRFIGIILCLVVILTTVRFPQMVTRWIKRDRYN